jgi:hypothetical protein
MGGAWVTVTLVESVATESVDEFFVSGAYLAVNVSEPTEKSYKRSVGPVSASMSTTIDRVGSAAIWPEADDVETTAQGPSATTKTGRKKDRNIEAVSPPAEVDPEAPAAPGAEPGPPTLV